MGETYFKKLRVYSISIVVLFVILLLCWEYFTGGVKSHYLLNRSDFPAISNWWGIVTLPLLTWFTLMRIKKRTAAQSNAPGAGEKLPTVVVIGFLAMLMVSVLQSLSFELGYESITMYIALGLLIAGLFLPVYRAEWILGHVLGAAVTFGPVIPILFISVIAAVSALSNLCIKPLLIRVWSRA
ncbi:hypothetical protein ACR0ST_00680 [Aliidiomarina sp. Khilg15.8]